MNTKPGFAARASTSYAIYASTRHSRCCRLGTQSRRRNGIGSQRFNCRASGSYGPQPPPKREFNESDWLKAFEDDMDDDDEVRQLLEGADGNSAVVRERMEAAMDAKRSELLQVRTGSAELMRVSFREVTPYGVWLWLEMYSEPDGGEVEMLNEVLRSWFLIGKLGGYNSMNLQVFYKSKYDASYLDYDVEESDGALDAFLHSMSALEVNGEWCRFRLDMGTADEISLDVLINMLLGFSRDHVGIKQLIVGGENDDWPVPKAEIPETDIDPMRITSEVSEEDEAALLAELAAEEEAVASRRRERQQGGGSRNDRLQRAVERLRKEGLNMSDVKIPSE